MNTHRWPRVFYRIMRFIGAFKYGVTFAIFLALFPVTPYWPQQFRGLFMGLFMELETLEIAVVTTALLVAAWSLMFSLVLLARDMTEIWRRPHPDLPLTLRPLLDLPITWLQLSLFGLLALPGIAVVLDLAPACCWPFVGVLAGTLMAYGLLIMLCAPAHLADRTRSYNPLPDSLIAPWCWARVRFAAPFFVYLHRLLSRIVRRYKPLHYLLENGVLSLDHYSASISTSLGFVLLAISTFCSNPTPGGASPIPTLAYLYLIILFFIWVFGFLVFHLRRPRLSALLPIVCALVFDACWGLNVHDFAIRPQPRAKEGLTPVEVAAANSQRNLVVVASSGGGIMAAGWTTLALQRMMQQRPQLVGELRLLSTISGASVGAAFYLDHLAFAAQPRDAAQREVLLGQVFEKATASSLKPLAYGIAFRDLWRTLSGGLLAPWASDRGNLLESYWQQAAVGSMPRPTLHMGDERMLQAVRLGLLPAPIFSTTVMETGSRIMATPIDFTQTRARATLSDYLAPDAHTTIDINVFTAARLSATFPYVTPAARARGEARGEALSKRAGHHFIDGGYYDNYGIASLLDWLEPVLQKRREQVGDTPLRFTRVLIVQLAVPVAINPPAEQVEGANSAKAEFLGPAIGSFKVSYNAGAERNRLELQRFIAHWNRLLEDVGVELQTVHFAPTLQDEKILTWHLSSSQKQKLLVDEWPASRQHWPNPIEDTWSEAELFLGQSDGK